MKIQFALLIFLVVGSVAMAQDEKVDSGDALAGFDVLKQFEGTWETASTSVATSEQEAKTNKGTMTSKTLGSNWVVNDYEGRIDGTEFGATQTLRFDAAEKSFNGSWVDSYMTMPWELSGSFEGKVLSIESEGPDYSRPGKKTLYRDMYEFKSDKLIVTTSQMQNAEGEWKTFMNGTMTKVEKPAEKTVLPFLMFIGKAEEAIEHYKTVYPDLAVESMEKWTAGEPGAEGTIKLAQINIEGQSLKVTDSPPVHDFTFTPSFSFFVECKSEEQLKERFEKLSEGGKVMMPLNNYGFSKQFGWVSDKFGVSWQLNLK